MLTLLYCHVPVQFSIHSPVAFPHLLARSFSRVESERHPLARVLAVVEEALPQPQVLLVLVSNHQASKLNFLPFFSRSLWLYRAYGSLANPSLQVFHLIPHVSTRRASLCPILLYQ